MFIYISLIPSSILIVYTCFFFSLFAVSHTDTTCTGYLGDTVGLVPDHHHNKVSIAIKL